MNLEQQIIDQDELESSESSTIYTSSPAPTLTHDDYMINANEDLRPMMIYIS